MPKNTKTEQTEAEEPSGPNKLTIEAGLTFNVTPFKQSCKTFATNNDHEMPKIGKGSQVGLTSFNESLCKAILESALHQTEESKAGLKNFTEQNLKNSVLLNDDLASFFKGHLHLYDSTLDYSSQYCVTRKQLKAFVDKIFGSTFNLKVDGITFLTYLLVKASSVIMSTAFELISYAKKKTLDGQSILSAININFIGELAETLKTKTNEAIKRTTNTEVGEEGDEEEEENIVVKSKKKKYTKNAKVEEEEEEEED
jgi:hypothetical protein